ncbi:hypothetical protein BST36_00200 [Mycolicibacterium moriokaense]|jgi:hypothetical protein|uniref:Intersectin-EH binding protein Ibp1 n=1 Tax=Mycolicibacterium moriokaense TaxID=39691 RepID=A0AAD1H9R7_9MYCO|nr:hypothetical protein [Mycolicibacterium moriokaense]MCV7041255.1 hypothetical protein [Mycolicibacterium moriokaense]ORB27148.1 hypothetical protein BST36_00200 [Mycolicibacterium moriokaense]BBX00821.1 hypothetical protein MMOR_17570 [Mycolicibacterium moriokaense]
MQTLLHSTRRLAIAGAFAAAPLVAAVVLAHPGEPASVAQCAAGEESDVYTGQCVPYLVPNSPAGGCPAGVSGAECNVQSQPVSNPPDVRGDQPAEPDQSLIGVSTPDY